MEVTKEAEDASRVRLVTIVEISRLLRHIVSWFGVCIVSFIGYLCIKELAGKTTMAEIFLQFIGKAYVSQCVMGLFGTCGIAYGIGQRNLRRKTVRRLEGRLSNLEAGIDPGRSSSHLDSEGRTPA